MEIESTVERARLNREFPLVSPLASPPRSVGQQSASESVNSSESARAARRPKSSLRLKYEAETQVIERKIGDLESIRRALGLSQRKMSQLLMVDPSAWTRWTKGKDEAPPHIYRMLQWYLALEEKYPALDVNFWLNTVAQVTVEPSVLAEHAARLAEFEKLQARVGELEHHLARFEGPSGLKTRAGRPIGFAATGRLMTIIALAAATFGGLIGFSLSHFGR